MSFVLVTGASGAIGQPVCEELERRGHRVRGLDLVPAAAPQDFVLGDVVEPEAVEAAFDGVDTLVHLAARPDDAPFDELIGPNVKGLFNVLDAARRHAVRRVVLASSVQVLGARSKERRNETSDRAPRNHYALTKLWAEEMGAMYARCYGLSVVVARIGWMVRNRTEAGNLVRNQSYASYLSRADVARFFACAVEAADVTFALLYAVGPGGRDTFDLESAKRVIGYEPRDEWPQGLPDA